jgi:hypothetical protein
LAEAALQLWSSNVVEVLCSSVVLPQCDFSQSSSLRQYFLDISVPYASVARGLAAFTAARHTTRTCF